ncbi:MAG TPA: hypothetical protein VLA90_10090, partial [Actinomycetota bacterium]|nr:hypothetical protein [Actinomycetota bacterium]
TVAAVPAPPEMPAVGRRRLRDNHRLLGMIAATILVLAAAFGVLSARQPAPPPAELESNQAPTAQLAPDRSFTVTVTARERVDVTIVVDAGASDRYRLEAGEGRSFDARTSMSVWLSSGGVARVTVAGRDLGFPGTRGRPWGDTFAFGSPSP